MVFFLALTTTPPVTQPLSIHEQLNRIQTIDSINTAGFQQQEFKSSRFTPKVR